MRIRQVRPEFFSDGKMAKLSAETRLTYIALWCVADDAGWFRWEPEEVAALVAPYAAPRDRVRDLKRAVAALVRSERLRLYDCGCAWLPTFAKHQRIGGRKSFATSADHQVHTRPYASGHVRAVGNGSGMESNGTHEDEKSFSERVPRPA